MLLRLERNRVGRMFFVSPTTGKVKFIECNDCKQVKPENEFDSHVRTKHNKQVYCRECDHVIRKENYNRQHGILV